jgi:anti-anti-sigma regulatory factor
MATTASAPLEISVARSDGLVTVRLCGVFGAGGVGAFSEAVGPLLYERRQPSIRLDLRALEHLSSSGLGAIVFAAQFAAGHGQSFEVAVATGQPASMLSVAALSGDAGATGIVVMPN